MAFFPSVSDRAHIGGAQSAYNFKTPDADIPESEVQSALSRLEAAITLLEGETEGLMHQLKPVLTTSEDIAKAPGSPAVAGADVRAPLTRRIEAAVDRVFELRNLMGTLRSDLRV